MTIQITPNNPQYRIVEIFESLQGEGWNTGMPAVFIRLGKCNLACSWCDTDYLKFGMMSLSDILGRLKTYTARNIIITGGEPTINRIWIPCLMHSKPKAIFCVLKPTASTLRRRKSTTLPPALKPATPPNMNPAASKKPTKCALLPTAMSLHFAKRWNAKSAPNITTSRLANKTV